VYSHPSRSVCTKTPVRTRRKGEITSRMNERDFPYVVELLLPDGVFGNRLDEFDAFHRLRGIESRRGRRQRRDEQEYLRWFFASVIDADERSGRRAH
jgi:hypothetical protein